MRKNSNAVQFIKDKAKELGFDGCGIASPVILEKDILYLKNWISGQKHGNIKYLEKNIDKKADPRKILGNAKSIITLIKSYNPSKKQSASSYYKIAKYAYGNDYHVVMKSKAARLIDEMMKKNKTAEFRIFVDSNSILEKAWAARCGLGWIGKNTLLINEKLGSFVFICVILTNLVLDYDELHNDNCGNCSACIDACPVNAIEMPYRLNASKCIACRTIESITDNPETGDSTKGWIYGCDICQDVCPWNINIPATNEPAFKPNPALLNMTKEGWKKINKKSFEILFKKSAVKRIGFEKLKNNIGNAS